MSTKRFQFNYPFSKFWLVFWIFFFFPIALVLLTRLEYISNTQVTRWVYEGDRFWLYFWVIFFFPVTLLLAFLNGALVVTSDVKNFPSSPYY